MISVDVSELEKLARGFAQHKHILPKSVEQRAMRRAVRPIFRAAKSEVPVGRVVSENGWGKQKGPDFRRGGATRKDLRIKNRTKGLTVTSGVWIGPANKPGRVGWRNHFITKGVSGAGKGKRINTQPNDYLTRAYNAGIGETVQSFAKETEDSFQLWAKKNLPQ